MSSWVITAGASGGLLLLLVCGLPLQAAQQGQEMPYPVQAPRAGEVCVVCGTELSEEDITLLVKGRRVPLKKEMLQAFFENQELYFSQMQPRSALFQEEFTAPSGFSLSGISSRAFLMGLYVLLGLVFAALSAQLAVTKGLSPLPYFLAGLFFTALGYLYTLSRPKATGSAPIPRGFSKVPTTSVPVPCWSCGAPNHPSALHCSGCHLELQPKLESEARRVLSGEAQQEV